MTVEAALARALGHEGPFTDVELATIDELTVVHARDLGPLARCTNLRRLTIVAGDLGPIGGLDGPDSPGLAALEHVRVVASRLESLGGLLDCARLARRDLLHSACGSLATADAEVLLAAPGGTVAGVPHSHSIVEYRAELGDVTSEYERLQCVRLWQRCGAVYGGGLLVRPGPPELTGNTFDALRLSTWELEQALDDPDFSLPGLFRRHPVVAPGEDELARRPVAPVLAWAAGAELWAEDRLGADRFAQRFPDAALRTDCAGLLDAVAGAYAPLVPHRYLLRAKLAKWLLLRDTPAVCLAGQPGRAWELGLSAAAPDPSDALLALGYLVIGREAGTCRRARRTVLAFTLDDAERVLLVDEAAALEDPAAAAPEAYPSYRALLDDITAVGPAQPAPGAVSRPPGA
jgi:hypothetical protein